MNLFDFTIRREGGISNVHVRTAKVKCRFVDKKPHRSDEKKLGSFNPVFGTGEKTTPSSEEMSIFFNTKHISFRKSEQRKPRRKGYTIKTSNPNIGRDQRWESSLHKTQNASVHKQPFYTNPRSPTLSLTTQDNYQSRTRSVFIHHRTPISYADALPSCRCDGTSRARRCSARICARHP